MAEGIGILNHPPPRVGYRRSSQWSRNEWPHLASLYASTHQLDEDGKHPDPMMGQDNVFDQTEPYNAYRYYIQPVTRSEFSIEEPPYANRPMYKDEESRSSDYTSGDSFRRGSTCRVLLCVTLVLSFIGVVVAAITLAVLLSQTPRPAKSSLIQPEVYQSEASMLGQDFNEKLLDKESQEFKKLSEEFCTAIEQIFTDQDSPVRHEFVGCEVLEFRNGSVEAVFRIKLLPKSSEGFKNEDRLIQKIQEHFASKIKQVGPWQSVKFNPDFIRRFVKVVLATTTHSITKDTTTAATTLAAVTEEMINTTIAASDSTVTTTTADVKETPTTTKVISNVTRTATEQDTTSSRRVTAVVSGITADAEVTTVIDPLISYDATTSPAVTSATDDVSTEYPHTSSEEMATVTETVIDMDIVNATSASNATVTTMISLPFDTTDDLGFQNYTEEDMVTYSVEQTPPANFTEGPSTESMEYNVTTSLEAQPTTIESVIPIESFTSEAPVGISTEGQTTTQFQTSMQELLSTDARQTTPVTGIATDTPTVTAKEIYEETKPATRMLEATTDSRLSTRSDDIFKTSETVAETSTTMEPTNETVSATQQTHAADTTSSASGTTTHLVSPTSFDSTHSITTDISMVDGFISRVPDTKITSLSSSSTTTHPSHSITTDQFVIDASMFEETTNVTNITTDTREVTTSPTATESSVTLTNFTEVPIDMFTDDFNYTDLFQNDTTDSTINMDAIESSINVTSNETSLVTEPQHAQTTTESSQFVIKKYTVVETVLPVTPGSLQIDISLPSETVTQDALLQTSTSSAAVDVSKDISLPSENVTQDVMLQTTTGFDAVHVSKTDIVTPPSDVSSTTSSAGQTLSTEYNATSGSPVDETTITDYIYTKEHTTFQDSFPDLKTTSFSDRTTLSPSITTKHHLPETTSDVPAFAENATEHSEELSLQPDTSDTTPAGPTVTDTAIDWQTTHSQSVLSTHVDSAIPSVSDQMQTSSVAPSIVEFSSEALLLHTTGVDHLIAHTISLPSTDTGTASKITDMPDSSTTAKPTAQTPLTTLMTMHATEIAVDAETMVQIIPGTDTVTTSAMTDMTPKTRAVSTPETQKFTILTEHIVRNITDEHTVTEKQMPVFQTTTEADHTLKSTEKQAETVASETFAVTIEAIPHTESTTHFEIHDGQTVDSVTKSVLILTGTDTIPSSGTDTVSKVVDIATSFEGKRTDTTLSVGHTVTPVSPASTAKEASTATRELVEGTSVTSVAETHISTDVSADYPQTTPVSILNDTITVASGFTSQPTDVAPTEQPAVSATEIIIDGFTNETDSQNFTDIMDTANITESLDAIATTGVTETFNVTVKLEPSNVTMGFNLSDTTEPTKATDMTDSVTTSKPTAHTVQTTVVVTHATEMTVDAGTMVQIIPGTDTVATSGMTATTPEMLSVSAPEIKEFTLLTEHIERNVTEEHTHTKKQLPVFNVTDSPIVAESTHTTDKPVVQPVRDTVILSTTLVVKDRHKRPGIMIKSDDATDILIGDHIPIGVNMTSTVSDPHTATADPANITVSGYSNETTDNMTYSTQNFTQASVNQTLTHTRDSVSYETSTQYSTIIYNDTASTSSPMVTNEYINENTTDLFDYNTTDIFDYDNVTDSYNATSDDPSASEVLVLDGSEPSETVKSNVTDSGHEQGTLGFEHSQMNVTKPMSATTPNENQAEHTSTASTLI